MEEIIGHKQIFDFFAKVKENNGLSHAYCFVGPKHVGKFTIAKVLAAEILGVVLDKVAISVDFFLLQQSIKEKTGKLGKDISIDQVREFISFGSRHSFLGGYKVAIVDQADLLSTGASNALLKTLEEPRSKTITFLITEDEDKLLPTILSRCQTVHFTNVSEDLIKNFLDKNNLSEEKKKYIERYSCGLPGIAVKLATDENYYIYHKNEIQRFEKLFDKLFYEKLSLVEELFGDKTDHIQARNNLLEVLSIWQTSLHIYLQEEDLDKKPFLNLYSSINKASRLLVKNVHPRLLIENILLQIP